MALQVYRIRDFSGGLRTNTTGGGQSELAPNECQEFKNVYHRGNAVVKRAGINEQAEGWQADDDYGIQNMISPQKYYDWPVLVIHCHNQVFELDLDTETDIVLWDDASVIREVFIPYHDCIFAMRAASSVGKVYKRTGDSTRITRDQGVPAPGAPTVAKVSGTELEEGTYYYKMTTVYGLYGESNGGTTTSPVITSSSYQQVQISSFPSVDTDWATKRRIYRTLVDAGSDGPFYLVDEIDYDDTTYTDDTPDDELGSALPPTDHDAPPGYVTAAALFRDRMWYGGLGGWWYGAPSSDDETNEIYYSKGFCPDLVPLTNKISVPMQVVTWMETFYETLLVFGFNSCYGITGYDPTSFSGRYIDYNVGAMPFGKPVVRIPGGLVAASPSSVYLFDGSRFRDIGEPIRDQIESTVMAGDSRSAWLHYHEDKVFLSISTSLKIGIHFMYDLRRQCWSETTIETNAACSLIDASDAASIAPVWFMSAARGSDQILRNEKQDKTTDVSGASIPWEIKTGWHDLGMECDFRGARIVTDPTHDYDDSSANIMNITLYVDDQEVKAATNVQGADGIFFVDMKGITGRKVMVRLFDDDSVRWVINGIDILFEPSVEEEAVIRDD